jgi:hypothetical protein
VPSRIIAGPAVDSGGCRPLALDVLRIEDGQIAEISTFAYLQLFAAFGLPAALGS